jgi:hypothetical protein
MLKPRIVVATVAVVAAAACMPTPAAYKTTVASMMSCDESQTDFSKPDMSDDYWVHGSGCGKQMDAVCDLTGVGAARCISLPAKLDDMLRWTLDGPGSDCTKATFTVLPAFKDRDDYREYDVKGCGDGASWRCGTQLDGSKRVRCLAKPGS